MIEVELLLNQAHHIALLFNALGNAGKSLLNMIVALSRVHQLLRNQVRQPRLLTNQFWERPHALRKRCNNAREFLLPLILNVKEHPKLARHGHDFLRVRRYRHRAHGIDPIGAGATERGGRFIAAKEKGSERGKESGHRGEG
ncbi:MAG: hypothetical protein DWH75_02695 [Planctomycetota bacterium]|nr:MAG: hypothetical protein DWH75_02695 [Planctomycetota bacterium]